MSPCIKTAVAEGVAQVLANGILESEESEKRSNPLSKIRNKVASLVTSNNEKETPTDNEAGGFIYELPPCPPSLLGARVINIELAGLVAGTSNRGDFESKMKNLIKEASENNVILFIGTF